ncbi:MAG TPA: hypothetical protein VN694_12165 [Caulobacteraceae bacterium]|nr:hypothetical protein [Caulobacteraceae bacterium]
MAKKEDPAPTEAPPALPDAPRKLALQFGPTPTPPGSRLKPGRK